MYGFLADAVVVLHFAFVLFVALGGLLILKWRWILWLHVPAVVWGVATEFVGWICPLTPLENHLRAQAGGGRYAGDFIGQYVTAVVYPEGLTRDAQLALGVAVLVLNLAVYIFVTRRLATRQPA
jgi:hypothetical protein